IIFVAMWCFFVMQLSLWCILMTSLFTDAATSLCPTSGYPSEPAPISVWTKPSESGGDIYRLGGEELLAEGYHRGAHGNDTLVVVLNRGPPHACPLHKCALRLTTNETLDDGTIVYHANEAATSPGHKIIYEELSLYCVRNSGDCGADVPIFTFKKPSANAYAYSIDPSVSITGFKRDAKPLCYGWSDRTITLWDRQSTMEHPSGCKPISSLINGEVIYQSSKSANFPFGSTATVQCKSGFTVVGPTTLTCTHFGWYPESALGSCVVQDAAQANYCEAFPSPQDGYVIYSAQGPGIYPSGTTAVLHCDTESGTSQITQEARCENGLWSKFNPGSCQHPVNNCSQLPSVLNGQVEYITDENGQFGIGTKAKLRCAAGYVPIGVDSVTCGSDGWMPVSNLGTCQLKSTENAVRVKRQSGMHCIVGMPMVLNGQVNYSHAAVFGPFPHGTQAALICNVGFKVSGESAAVCNGQSWQPASFGICIRNDSNSNSLGLPCHFGLPPPIGGTVSYSQGSPFGPFPSGTAAYLECTSGFPQGSTSSRCTNGQWNPSALGACTSSVIGIGTGSMQCSVGPPAPLNGKLTYSSGSMFGPFSSGTVVSVSCESGFTLSGPRNATCINSQWSPSTIARCVREGETQCSSSISVPLNGRVSYSDGRSYAPFLPGTTATLTCDTGYQPSGEITSQCINGKWEPSSFSQCAQGRSGGTQCLFGIGAPLNGRIHYSNDAMWGPFPDGTSAGLVCYSGSSPSGATLSTCQNGQWAPTALGQCIQRGGSGGEQCHAGLPTPFNGQITYSNNAIFGPFPSGTSAALSCNFGHSPSGGSTQSTCKDGKWSPSSLAQCLAGGGNTGGAHCSSGPMTPANGQLSYSNGMLFGPFPPGTSVSLSCNFGYSPSGGSTQSTCKNGNWSPSSLAQCLAGGGNTGGAHCFSGPMTPANGQLSYSNGMLFGPFPPGTSVSLSCNFGHSPSGGSTQSTCKNGNWSPSSLAQCLAGGGNTGGAHCFSGPMTPANGQLSYSNGMPFGPFPSGTVARLTCTFGFTASGPTSSTCSNGAWNPPTMPQCIQGGSGAPCQTGVFPPLNGRVTYSNGALSGPFPSGTTVTVSCNLGYAVSGTVAATCINGQFNPTTLGQCVQGGVGGIGLPAQCFGLVPPFNGQISYSQQSSASTYPSGTIATLICNLGFTVSGGSTASTCINGQWNPSTLGTCQTGIGGSSGGTSTAGQCLFALPSVSNGNIQYSGGNSVGPFHSGTSASLICNFGFTPTGSTTSFCSNGVWQPSNLGSCRTNGINEYNLGGSNVPCLAVFPVLEGQLSYSELSGNGMYHQGTVVVLTCNAGYSVSGLSTATCFGGGWTPFPGIGYCKQTEVPRSPFAVTGNALTFCPAQMHPFNGNINYNEVPSVGSFPTGTVARLQCNLGFTVSGPSSSTCSDGVWSPQLGVCQAGIGSFSGSGSCTPLAVPNNGKIFYIQAGTKDGNELGTAAILTCETGFTPSDQTMFTCTAEGWAPKNRFPACLPANQLQ
uniref:Sushi domain-containing protein n=2 Tax=Parascaris univalens TaxID=6257 RepID=A0A915AFV3_PARUN